MSNQTLQNDKNNRGEEFKKRYLKALCLLWLGMRDSNLFL